MNFFVQFLISDHSWCFESDQIALAYGSCKLENFQTIQQVCIYRCNGLAFIQFPIYIK